MPKPYDATLKDLAEVDPAAFLSAFDTPPTEPVTLLNVDLSTVTAAADVVFGLGVDGEGNPSQVVHLDAQSGPDADKGRDVLVYSALLHRKYRVPVHSILLLLHPKASLNVINGEVRYAARPARGRMDFGYEVVRLWERPAEEFLTSALNLTPLATLAQLPAQLTEEEALGAIVRRVVERLDREAAPGQARRLATAAYIFTGLRLRDKSVANSLFGGIDMRESVTYQWILEEGRLDEARRTLFRYAEPRIGPPPDEVRAVLATLNDIERIHRMTDLVLEKKGWDEVILCP